MKRCMDLAANGLGYVSPNPMVGALLVHNDRIISEGFHAVYGKEHAEVVAIQSVKKDEEALLSTCTLYVNLEPCAHYGKTPPCTNLIIEKKIPMVVVAQRDPNPLVSGRGIQLLRDNGIAVTEGILEKEAHFLNRRFNTYHEKKRPYIILKWAQTSDGYMGSGHTERLLISDTTSQTLSHKWRTQEQAVLIGYHTALLDNPMLTARLVNGRQPLRIVIDKNATLPRHLHLFNNTTRTIVFSTRKPADNDSRYITLPGETFIESMMQYLYESNISSVIIEGGQKTLQQFIDNDAWDEARIFHSNKRYAKTTGVKAPYYVSGAAEISTLNTDTLHIHYHI